MGTAGELMAQKNALSQAINRRGGKDGGGAHRQWRNFDAKRLRSKVAATQVTLAALAKAQVVRRETLKRTISI
jgi:hypothetical protein